MFERCDTKTLEFLLVSRLGLEGVDCLRNAIQLVRRGFVDCRVEKICEIVNKIAPVPLTKEECKSLLMVLPRKLTSFVRRKTDPRAFDDELWELMHLSKLGPTSPRPGTGGGMGGDLTTLPLMTLHVGQNPRSNVIKSLSRCHLHNMNKRCRQKSFPSC